jgi:hypothetical protein
MSDKNTAETTDAVVTRRMMFSSTLSTEPFYASNMRQKAGPDRTRRTIRAWRIGAYSGAA